MTAKWRHDVVDAQQLLLPQVTGLLLAAAILSAVIVPFPYGLILCGVTLTLLAGLLRRNVRRRRQGIDGWPTALILGPFVASTALVIVGTLVSELLAGVLLVAFVVGALVLFVRRARRSS